MPTFTLAPVDEVHLHDAPLAKVLMQVQYSRTPELVTDAAESALAEALGRYPVRRRQLVAGAFPTIIVNGQQLPSQVPATTPGVLLTFSDPRAHWQVVISETSTSIETSTYSSRDDFCDRAQEVFEALVGVALPPVVDRLGLRYIDRILGEHLQRVPEYVIPELRALYGSVDSNMTLQHSVTDSLIKFGDSECLQVRTGLLPANGAFDPSLLAVDAPSWLLDMDVFTTEGGDPFDVAALTARLRHFAETAYSCFRFATTPVFLDAFRGVDAAITGDVR